MGRADMNSDLKEIGGIEPAENTRDEEKIIQDQDATLSMRPDDEQDIAALPVEAQGVPDLEAPEEFVEGKRDVKEQMDRTTRRAEDALDHLGVESRR